MNDVVNFPGVTPRTPTDVWDDQERRRLDAGYILEVLEAKLPPEALRNVSGRDLKLIADHALLAVDTARQGRKLDDRYDERRAKGKLGALEDMMGSSSAQAAPEPIDSPKPHTPADPSRGEYEALRDLIDGPPTDDPSGPAVA